MHKNEFNFENSQPLAVPEMILKFLHKKYIITDQKVLAIVGGWSKCLPNYTEKNAVPFKGRKKSYE